MAVRCALKAQDGQVESDTESAHNNKEGNDEVTLMGKSLTRDVDTKVRELRVRLSTPKISRAGSGMGTTN